MRLKRSCFCLAVVVATVAGLAYGGVGELHPVACDINTKMGIVPLRANGRQIKKRTTETGTVSPRAVIVTAPVHGGKIKIAIDSRSPEAKRPDVVRFDFTGKGAFDDERALVLPLCFQQRTNPTVATFGPRKFEISHGGRTIPVIVQGHYTNYGGRWRTVELVLGAGLEGVCAFGEKIHAVRIIDAKNNLRIGDRPCTLKRRRLAARPAGDVLLVDTGDGTFGDSATIHGYYGQAIQVDDAWWDVNISPEGDRVTATKIEVETGEIAIPHEQWSACFVSARHVLKLSGGKDPIAIPADRYAIIDYIQRRRKSQLHRNGSEVAYPGRAKLVEVPAGKLTEIAIGPPIRATVKTRQRGRVVGFSFEMYDTSGSLVTHLEPIPKPPRLKVFDAAGKLVHSGRFEYG